MRDLRQTLYVGFMVFVIFAVFVASYRSPPIFWFYAGLAIGVAVHETGHLLCAMIGSIAVRLVSVGVGPVLLRGRIAETWLELRLLPVAGFVSPYPPMSFRKRWLVLVLLGGVLGNAALIGVIIWFESVRVVSTVTNVALGPIIFAQIFGIVVNLFPFRARDGETRRESDGLQLLRLLWRMPRNGPTAAGRAYATLLSRYGGTGELRPAVSPAASRIAYHSSRDRWASEEVRHESEQALVRELARGKLQREEEMVVLDCLVTEGLIFGDLALRFRLDEWSLRALELGPENETLLGSRGAVLVELGRFEEGKVLLTKIAHLEHDDPFHSLMTQLFLARAEHALGNGEAARRVAAAARKTAETSQASPAVMSLVARIEAQLAIES